MITTHACSSAIRGAKGGSDGGGQSVLLSRSPGGRGEARERGKSRRRTSGLAQVHDEVSARLRPGRHAVE